MARTDFGIEGTPQLLSLVYVVSIIEQFRAYSLDHKMT